ncbi:MAG: GNAT family N-acetyltransferase [Cyanobacteria bacterium P01_D01_bin.56]
MVEVIRQTDSLTDKEKKSLFGWGENIFGVRKLNLSWRSKDRHFLLYSDGELASHVGILQHVVIVNGEAVTVGGVGGVVTIPESQKKGFARQLMQHTAKFLEQEWKVDAGLLFCFPEMGPYYEAYGWQQVQAPV